MGRWGADVRTIVNRIPNNLKQLGKCDEFAQSLVNALDEKGIPYQIIRIDSKYGIYSDKAAMSIGQGYHYGVQVGNTVYDNMTPGGIELSTWLEDLGLTQGLNSISWNYTDIITNY
ncbi:MAG: hypothetical protein NC427_06080 [Ruminococcus flavefaciens]|nr:hypothetical protein [Ruminococcus flavefaciens]